MGAAQHTRRLALVKDFASGNNAEPSSVVPALKDCRLGRRHCFASGGCRPQIRQNVRLAPHSLLALVREGVRRPRLPRADVASLDPTKAPAYSPAPRGDLSRPACGHVKKTAKRSVASV